MPKQINNKTKREEKSKLTNNKTQANTLEKIFAAYITDKGPIQNLLRTSTSP
jgi:hypothetical protein